MRILIVEDYPELGTVLAELIAQREPNAGIVGVDNLDEAVAALSMAKRRAEEIEEFGATGGQPPRLAPFDAVLCDATFPRFPNHRIPFDSLQNPPRILWHEVAGHAQKAGVPFALLTGSLGEIEFAKRKGIAAFEKTSQAQEAISWAIKNGRKGAVTQGEVVVASTEGEALADSTGEPY